jgi:hypothetical protein
LGLKYDLIRIEEEYEGQAVLRFEKNMDTASPAVASARAIAAT